ncbi:MAG: hypothetical protein QT09_C0017G0019 [archaeon GW2011_AR18]|nr:MAG: hypothetical protein QT09_C0017G0019 [archaeon GW2011_AR18]
MKNLLSSESLELMANSQFIKSYNISKKHIIERNFYDWNKLFI